ncbi:MAG: 4Fe-4S dicluster domain-containing protein [Candidatus Heimdallarchaeota archaeon]
MTKAIKLYKEDFSFCFRCGMCSSGCLVFDEFDYKPHEIPLTLAFGDIQKLISNKKIWLCLTCLTCSERCPQGVEVAELLMDIKNDAIKAGFVPDPVREEALLFIDSGVVVPYTAASKRMRQQMKLTEPTTPNIEEIQKIMEVTGFYYRFKKKESME